MNGTATLRSERLLGPCLLVVLAIVLAVTVPAAEASEFKVRYRSAEAVYLDAGAAAGLAVGDELEILRDSKAIARVEIIYVAQYSASCRILSESTAVERYDLAVVVGDSPRGQSPEPPEESLPPMSAGAISPTVAGVESAESVSVVAPEPKAPARSTRISGSVTLDHETFQDDSDLGLDFTRTTGRVKIRARDIGGTPFEFRLRFRGQQNERFRALANGAPESESRDRLYEAALIYEPAAGRFGFRLGRMSSNPFIGVGFLDGGLANVRLTRRISVGGFFGSRPVLSDSAFETSGQKYGLYSRFLSAPESAPGARPVFELVTAAVREDGEQDVSREYFAVETRYTPSRRWSLYQRAEVDMNRGWRRELSDSSSQLSFLSLTAIARMSDSSRFALSYDRTERYRTEETRSIEEELFDDLMRQGLRATLSFGNRRGLNYSLTGGLRQRDDGEDDTVSYGAGIYHSTLPWSLSASANVLGFTNRMTEGYVLTVRTAKRFSGGHQVDIAAGFRNSQGRLFDDEEALTSHWIRLGGWYELPADLFLRGEYEVGGGDELDSQRFTGGLGFRF